MEFDTDQTVSTSASGNVVPKTIAAWDITNTEIAAALWPLWDFTMSPGEGECDGTGLCHARGMALQVWPAEVFDSDVLLQQPWQAQRSLFVGESEMHGLLCGME